MGLLIRNLYLLAREHKKYPIKGDVLTLGQQSVHATIKEAKTLFEKEGIVLKNLPLDFDTKNKIPDWEKTKYENYANCQAILTLLGAKRVYAADISSYENPDIIMDLNIPVSHEYCNKFDIILDIGTLEHIFNISQALENIKTMLKPGGTIILGYPSSNFINHGFYHICPTLLYDYFSANGFDNFSCFILKGSNLIFEKKAKIYQCNTESMTEDLTLPTKNGVEIMFFANKPLKNDNLQGKIPVQTIYKASCYWQEKGQNPANLKKNKLLSHLLFISRKWRPEIIDRTWKKFKTRKNLIYLGRH
jgi:SAM-dependent methyltransferase